MLLAVVLLYNIDNGLAVAIIDGSNGLRNASLRSSNTMQQDSPSTGLDYGNLACMRRTGGTCRTSSCKAERGPTVCESGKCMCASGYCAIADGSCVQQQGKWLGPHSIKSLDPRHQQKPYLGLDDSWSLSTFKTRVGFQEGSEPVWKIAVTPEGLVRFESLKFPGYVMTVVQVQSATDIALKRTSTSSLWVISPFEELDPIDVTFQARPDMQGNVLLTYVGKETNFLTHALEFTPSLPLEATHSFTGFGPFIGVLHPWQHNLLGLAFLMVLCWCCCLFGPQKDSVEPPTQS